MRGLNRLLMLGATVALVAACGGSGDTAPPAPAPAPAAVAPTITTQPANASVAAGQTATFAVVAAGTAPLAYQWQRNGIDIAGASAASYTTPATVVGDSGATFRAVVSNSAGSATSNSASLTVAASTNVVVTLAAPTAGTQPKRVGLAWIVSGPGAGAITSYRALLKASDAAAYQPLPDVLAGASGTVALPSLTALDWAQARIRVQACDAAMTCTDSNEQALVGVLPAAIGYFKASNSAAQDLFGVAVALSGDGNFLAVGSCCEDSNATGINGDQSNNLAANSGAVYVFVRTAGAWSQQAYLKASNAATEDRFGYSVAISAEGNTLVIGAWGEDSAATGVNGDQSSNAASNSGAAYVFVRDGSTWTQQAYLKASNTGANDEFGRVVAISPDGNTIAVGVYEEDSAATGINGDGTNNAAAGSGAVYVYARTGTTWIQEAYIKASNAEGDDNFGRSVSLSGDGLMAVGAWGESSSATGINGNQASNASPFSGAVYVFARNPSNVWFQQAYIKASNTGSGDNFGVSVALSSNGNTLAVGAALEDSAATGVNGNGSDNSATNAGAVYAFVRNGNVWSQQAYLKASNTGADDRFGFSVALSNDGNRLAIGATQEASAATGIGGDQGSSAAAESGAAYVFVRNGSAWSQQAYVKASNTDATDGFGWSLGLSGDGNTLAVGAFGEDSSATGIGGDQANNAASGAGAVYLY